MARPRVLVLAQCLPYPPDSGVASRTFNILKQLELEYDVDLVSFSRLAHQPDAAARDAAWRALQGMLTTVAEPTPIPNEHSALRRLWDHARSFALGRSYTHYEYESDAFGDRLRTVLKTRTPDLVHLDSLDLSRWTPDLPGVPVTCTHHDIDSELLRRRARRFEPAVLRPYLRLQAARVERLAREVCPGFALNVMMSDLDADRLRALAPGSVTVTVPNGTDTEVFRPSGMPPVKGRVVFVGPTFSHPNRDAVAFLLRDIWPRIRARKRDATLQLVGGGSPADLARFARTVGVHALGRIPDVRGVVGEASCSVVPIRVGGGTRLKILDAWAMGKAIVSTSIGCEGLDARDGENILIRDTPDAFADGVLSVLEDDALRTHLEGNARRTAVEGYSWDIVGRKIRFIYDELLGKGAPTLAVR